MRRTLSMLAVLVGTTTLGLPDVAQATPTVNLKVAAVPVPLDPSRPHSATYPGTGAIYGAPFAAQLELAIHGHEYRGAPLPITQVKLWAPAGVKLSANGFATCMEAALKERGPQGCPKRSFAGPMGEARGETSFGSERVHETVSLQAFFAPGGGFYVFVEGRTPASIELITKGVVGSAPGGAPFGLLVTSEVPLVESVPGALDASVEFIKIEVGAAYKKGNKLVSYLTAPKRCPKGGFPAKVEVTFLGGETVTASYIYPCPKRGN